MKLFSAAGGASPLVDFGAQSPPTVGQAAKFALNWILVPEIRLTSKLESESGTKAYKSIHWAEHIRHFLGVIRRGASDILLRLPSGEFRV
jgi:hypothetical protein